MGRGEEHTCHVWSRLDAHLTILELYLRKTTIQAAQSIFSGFHEISLI